MLQQPQAMEQWYHDMPGAALLKLEQEQVGEWLSHLLGDCLVQIGGNMDMSLTVKSPIANKIYLGDFPMLRARSRRVQIGLDELPLLPDSVDVMLCPHILEFMSEPELLLKESYDALAPNGHLLILGFNPWSWWGFSRWKNKREGYPWAGHFWSEGSIKRRLKQLDYRIVMSRTLCFRPPTQDKKRFKQLLFLEAFGQLFCPAFGGVYFIAAQKRVHNVKPLLETPWWQRKIVPNGSCAEPTTRV